MDYREVISKVTNRLPSNAFPGEVQCRVTLKQLGNQLVAGF